MTRALKELLAKALAANRCDTLMEKELAGKSYPTPPLILSVGKSASSMAAGAMNVLPGAEVHLFTSSSYMDTSPLTGVRIHPGEHPVPGEGSFRSGKEILDLVRHAAGPILLLLSGGGSSLVESPLSPWIREDEIRVLNDHLLKSSFGINEINCLRKHVSGIKGGRLALASSSPVETYLFSDVPPDRADVVASGPTLPDPSTKEKALTLLSSLPGLSCGKKFASLFRDPAFPETPKPDDPTFERHPVRTLADNGGFLRTLISLLNGVEIGASLLLDNRDMGVEEAVEHHLEAFHSLSPMEAVVSGGEFTYALPPHPGLGGRCLHFAALWALRAADTCSDLPWTLLAAATDGHDGLAPTGGVVVKSENILPHRGAVRKALQRADTYALWQKFGDVLPKTSTGINLRDAFVLIRR